MDVLSYRPTLTFSGFRFILRRLTRLGRALIVAWLVVLLIPAGAMAEPAAGSKTKADRQAAPETWAGSLAPIQPADWSYDRAAHLLERAGFGGTPDEVAKLAAMTPEEAVSHLLDYESIDVSHLPAFDESNIYPNGYKFIPLQQAAPKAMATGKAFGIAARREGDLPLQPGVNEFYTILWSDFGEMNRAGQWWAQRMLLSPRPLEEKMTLFWHDHFATSQAKVHRHRKMLRQIDTLRRHAVGNFRDLLIAVSQDPAMLIWLDNKDNVKGKPNENYAREIMELFTMGEGQGYGEEDIREVARAFTGWTLTADETTEPGAGDYIDKAELHDEGVKELLGKKGKFNGYDAVDVILAQGATPRFLSGKIYRQFVRQHLTEELNAELAQILVESKYELRPLLRKLLLSQDFYSSPSVATQIKGPVELVVSTYRKLGLESIPGIPDFNELCANLGQTLFFPPNVAGWPGHQSWINPATLLTRGNFVHTLLFPPDPKTYEPPDKDVHEGYRKIPLMFPEYNITPYIWDNETQAMEAVALGVYDKYLAGMDISDAKQMMAEGGGDSMAPSSGAAPKMMKSKMGQVAQGEMYNLAVGVYTGHVQANDRVKPIPRTTAQLDFVGMVRQNDLDSASAVVDYFLHRFLRAELHPERRAAIVSFLTDELGGESLDFERQDLEDVLRQVVHLILSAPEYQLA